MTARLAWRKPGRSSATNCCVEAAAVWRRASPCGESGQCVEVADHTGVVLVRDSKDPNGPRLTFTPDSWAAFLAGVKTGELAATDG